MIQLRTYVSSAVAGPNGHLERAQAGDTMYIQHVGNDSGGKYTITSIDAEGGGPTGYFKIYVEFVEGFSDGNIEHPGYDQIQVVSKDLSDIYVLKAGDTMTGDILVMDDADILMDNGDLEV